MAHHCALCGKSDPPCDSYAFTWVAHLHYDCVLKGLAGAPNEPALQLIAQEWRLDEVDIDLDDL